MNLSIKALMFFLSLSVCTAVNAQEEKSVQSFMTNAAIYVSDIDASLKFYTEYMGYMVRADTEVTAGKSKDTMGIDQGFTTKMYYLAPKPEFTEPGSFAGGLALVEVHSDDLHTYERVLDSVQAVNGEIIMVHKVQNIKKIYETLVANDIKIVTPLSPSGSGKSMSFSAFDPDGVRVEMWEMLPKKD